MMSIPYYGAAIGAFNDLQMNKCSREILKMTKDDEPINKLEKNT